MEPICTNPDCGNIIKAKKDDTEIPKIMTEISDLVIENLLAENLESFHIHQYGSTVIFLKYLENLDPSDELINEYSEQGHVFLLPIKPLDLVRLKENKIDHITYKAMDQENDRVWYRIILIKKKKSLRNMVNKLLKKK